MEENQNNLQGSRKLHDILEKQENKKLFLGLIAIFLGGFGLHKFLLGHNKEGIIQLVVTFITCGAGSVIGLIEGIIYLTKSDEEFNQIYIIGDKKWF
ncbi:NINE protein [Flavobacteriaceae bacterium Ap0902]|nr:NINE protein [Flavobacteriaceae bacterium Ap0902]